MRKSSSFFLKTIDKWFFIYYNIKVAGVAQSVVQLIRNQQVVCSSHITSSRKKSNAICVRLFSVMIALWQVMSLDMLRIVMIWLRQS